MFNIAEVCNKSHKLSFSFSKVGKRHIKGDTETGPKKAAQKSDIPFRIAKENSDIFSDFPLSSFNDATDKSCFSTPLKQAK